MGPTRVRRSLAALATLALLATGVGAAGCASADSTDRRGRPSTTLASGSPTRSTGTTTPAPATTATGTLFGTNAWTGDGSTYAQALSRQTAAYGALEAVRTFHSGLPAAWPGPAGLFGGPVAVSFKARPLDVTAGVHDAFFRSWFAAAPRDRTVWWTFFHEPEDDIEDGAFTAAQYRAAVRHLDRLADAAGNPRLRTTTIWMCWTLRAPTRDWRDYYPGADVVDVLGFDCYNRGAQKRTPVYTAPSEMLGGIVSVARTAGKPFGIAELGSQRIASDPTGSGRAAWLTASATYLRASQAQFVTYFDAYGGSVANPEYRLLDAPSKAAWRWAVSGS